MRRLKLFMICLMLSALCFAQNQSDQLVQSSIALTDQLIGNQEIFRFNSGLVTQLDFTATTFDSTLFKFDDSRWFSIGRFNTGSQEVYGLRFQLPKRSVTFGYQDTGDDSPRIQWIDDRNGPGNLEFRFANDFFSTSSSLVAQMTNKGQFVLPSSNFSTTPSNDKLSVSNNNFNNGIAVRTIGLTNENDTAEGVGIEAESVFNDNNIAVKGTANGGFFIRGTNIAIMGNASVSGGYAGFFNGNVNVTGTFTNPSDRRLKENIKPTKNSLEKLSSLSSHTFNFKENEQLNLPIGKQYGFISQEVAKVYPELVKEITYPVYDDNDEYLGIETYKSINYIGLISELSAAINELNKKVEDIRTSKTTLVYSSRFTEEELAKIKANGYQLEQNVPNPFSGATSITYSLPKNAPRASIMVFDLSGKLLKTYELKERAGQLRVNQSDLGKAGMYLYSLFAGGQEIMTKRMLVK